MAKKVILIILLSLFCIQVQSEGVAVDSELDPNLSPMDVMDDYLRAIGQESTLEEIPVEQFNPPVRKIYSNDLLPHLGNDDVGEVVRLINAGIDVNADLGAGTTPLMYAESAEMAKALIDLGADVNHKAFDGSSVLHYAVSADRAEEILSVLLKAGAVVNVVSVGMNGETPFLATKYLFIEQNAFNKAARIARILYRYGASVDAQDEDGYTALMTATVNDKPRMAEFMLMLGSDVNLRSVDGKTALEYAKELGHYDIADLIIKSPY
ncbi:MAG: hypothetical protein HKP55_04335 [Gammaproteobacteria bacterium]|nr:hypothetical protein [Gammaproteobacteria bacterium]